MCLDCVWLLDQMAAVARVSEKFSGEKFRAGGFEIFSEIIEREGLNVGCRNFFLMGMWPLHF